MCDDRLIVLKFGGSVLRDDASLRLAVHEIYRWRRDGYQVVAVVSALAGQTDALLRHACDICDFAAPNAVAALVSTGEQHSAALLGLHLDRAGVPACVLTPGAIRLVAGGPPLDADPVSLDDAVVRRALERDGVVVVPGYVAHDSHGRTVVMGRGGSDLTALFLAHRLCADRCRLIKDVDGLYECDPALGTGRPGRYARISWSDALATDGTVVQHKAIAFAQKARLPFELGGLNGVRPTEVGAGPTTLDHAVARDTGSAAPRRARVALLGLGTVGGGVLDLLRQRPDRFEVASVAVRDPSRPRTPSVEANLLTTDAVAAAGCGADIVLEAMGGIEPARTAIEAALRAGADVVTANKALMAAHGARLTALATARGRRLCFSASVGGSMPLLERLAAGDGRRVRTVRAVLNGTTNFVLDRVAAGAGFDEAVREAQQRGFAERDPHRDLSGLDAADKLCIIARVAGAGGLRSGDVLKDELTERSIRACCSAAGTRFVVRHVATLDVSAGAPVASVRLTALRHDDSLADVSAEQNAAVIEWWDGEFEVIRGRGAGRWPTAEAVLADVLDITRRKEPVLPTRRNPARRERSRMPALKAAHPGRREPMADALA